MQKNSKGFTGVVNLSWVDPKSRENIIIKMIPDPELYEPKETANEARHYAATFALHRINYVKNMKFVLPNIFKDYWGQLDNRREILLKQNRAEHDKVYNVNPFQVYLNEKDQREKRVREKEVRENNQAKISKPMQNLSVKISKPIRTPKIDLPKLHIPQGAWLRAPFIDIPTDLRASIESSVKFMGANWRTGSEAADSSFLPILTSLGFREQHAKEALNNCSNGPEAFEWLLFHIPQDDLPPLFTKTEEESQVSLKVSKDWKLENLLERLSQSGFDKDDICTTLEKYQFDEIKTGVALTQRFCLPRSFPAISEDQWDEEVEGLIATGIEAELESEAVIRVRLNLENLGNKISARFLKCENYPNEMPGVILVLDKGFVLANYIKLAILRQLVQYLHLNNIFGEPFLFNIIEWLEQNIDRIINDPGPLAPDVSAISKTVLSNEAVSTRETSYNIDLAAIKRNYLLPPPIGDRSNLPAWSMKDRLVDVISRNRITLVTGETGSGKSTQTVQFVLDALYEAGNFSSTIFCTQPRRISVLGLAERVAAERNASVGKEVGYIIRGENKTGNQTRLTFATTGVFLRILQSSLKTQNQGVFENLEYIFVDEVHERSVDVDFLLILLKRFMKRYPKLKIVLMSATTDLKLFEKLFGFQIKNVHILGRTFPISDYYLESILDLLDYTIELKGELVKPKAESHFFSSGRINYDLIAKVCQHIDRELVNDRGSILVFLPGVGEINKAINAIEQNFARNQTKCSCLPLHSALAPRDQKLVFKHFRDRKIVVATNVAETSITIPDCVAVVDAGRSKTMYFDPETNSTKLVESWCSKAEIRQRRGRAGRVREGRCYHLYTKNVFEGLNAQPTSEISRMRVESLYLIAKSMNVGIVEDFLKEGIDAPEDKAVKNAKDNLIKIGALHNDELTHLGEYLAYLPLDIQNGKLLIFGCIFNCLDPCLTIAAVASTGSPFNNNFEQRHLVQQVKNELSEGNGDIFAMMNAVLGYEKLKGTQESRKYILSNFLSKVVLDQILLTKTQFLSTLQEIGFIPNQKEDLKSALKELNKCQNLAILRGVITGAFHPNIAHVQLPSSKFTKVSSGSIAADPDSKLAKFWVQKDGVSARAFAHPSSVLYATLDTQIDLTPFYREDGTLDESIKRIYDTKKTKSSGTRLRPFAVYSSASLTNKFYLREITPTSTMAALLFGGPISFDLSSYIASQKKSPGIVMDNWIPIRTWCKNGVFIKRVRFLLDQVIDNRLAGKEVLTSKFDSDLLLLVGKLVSFA